MLKLNASYSKKVPAEGEYSSQSYHASIECELPDGLNANQLQERIHDTFELVRQSVEAELHGGNRQQQTRQSQQPDKTIPASPKQIRYLLDLARMRGITPQQIAAKFNVADVQQLYVPLCGTRRSRADFGLFPVRARLSRRTDGSGVGGRDWRRFSDPR